MMDPRVVTSAFCALVKREHSQREVSRGPPYFPLSDESFVGPNRMPLPPTRIAGGERGARVRIPPRSWVPVVGLGSGISLIEEVAESPSSRLISTQK